MTLETWPIDWAHRNEAFLQSLDDLPEDDGLLVVTACYEVYLRMRDMYVASAQIRGDEADDWDHQGIAEAWEYQAIAV